MKLPVTIKVYLYNGYSRPIKLFNGYKLDTKDANFWLPMQLFTIVFLTGQTASWLI